MTPQEASEELKEEFEIFKTCIHKADWDNPNEELKKIIEANTMAIEVLEQQPCEDCISREAVIRLVEQYPNIIGSRCSGLIADIKHLPSVTPSIPDVEDNFDIGYNCGCADAMCDIGGES